MDQISNLLVSIKNAIMSKKGVIFAPKSKHKIAILEILKNSGYVNNFEVNADSLKILINTNKLENLKLNIDSKPSRRMYVKSKNIINPKKGLMILSTPKGVMDGKSAKKQNLGGERICTLEE
ncbi:MAG: small subunit ribosomal protein S8 [Candidatus Berkelbacteria bacterium Licking1014_85]|uniref:Small ribosomal subunit protein uS8 n=1 Tax=Candidatus Berkelbacteria bacterium Licking1014_85 TaxID=2017148 RepID=A0A554LLZ4_9BACT|nr:MAG: small subunit ribosomal protein S8 [Candidatus Berkelbacteria bacterium Licking1014_85]